MSNFGLKFSSDFGLLDLTFTEAFGFLGDSGHHGELAIMSVVIVESIFVCNEVHVNAIGLVDNESTFALAVISDTESFTDVLQGENVSDCLGVVPHGTVVLDVGLGIGGQSATIAMYCHGLFRLGYLGDEFGIAEEIYRGLVIQKDHVTEIERRGGSRTEPKVKNWFSGSLSVAESSLEAV